MIKVAVTGAAGKMGSGIVRKITEQEDMEVVAAIEMPNTPLAGNDIVLMPEDFYEAYEGVLSAVEKGVVTKTTKSRMIELDTQL